MSYQVSWLQSAEAELARIYNAAFDKREVTAAANAIDRILKRSAGSIGESRDGDLRVHFEKPLAIKYQINELDRTVQVTHVWRVR